MEDILFSAQEITKKYKEHMALSKLNMHIKRGDIYGFIGANGAGKTTTIRLITGLIQPTSGEYQLFGKNNIKEMSLVRRKLGCIIEYPALYPQMTARENLEVQCYQRGIRNKKIINEVLKTVDLTETGRRKCKDFSLGMRQRLGLAIALLGEPEFLLLDEPTNGLDPMGIIELRKLLKELNQKKGITILISSHILTELDKIATTYGIINKGTMLEEISHDAVSMKCSKYINLRVTKKEKAIAVLEKELRTENFEISDNDTIYMRDYVNDVKKVARTLYEAGIGIKEIALQGETLESYFKKCIGGNG